jgi:2-C-methyl-D-erythritol 4-phosphate cytidylyltransferase/2-C-methyl-D-erythritol 2,4-cyclodiphosphate synthase
MAENNKKIGVVIVAGGAGTRFGAEKPKQYTELKGKTVLQRSIEAFNDLADVVQVVIRNEDIEEYSAIAKKLEKPILEPVFGAAKRQGSVKNGLIALEKHGVDIVLIHDAARPLVSKEVIKNVIDGTIAHGAAIPAIATKDTLKMGKRNVIEKTISRRNLFSAQTPQGFDFENILHAHKKLQNFDYTDDSSLIEAMGEKVVLVEGDEYNLKITNQRDLALAEKILN